MDRDRSLRDSPYSVPGVGDETIISSAINTLLVVEEDSGRRNRPVQGVVMSTNGHKKRASTKLPGTVEKVIKPHPQSNEPEKAQIAVEGADHLYRELRVPNKLTDEEGHPVKLKEGTEVEVKIETENVVSTGQDR